MNQTIFAKNSQWISILPDKKRIENWVEELYYWLFSLDKKFVHFDDFSKEENRLKVELKKILESTIDQNKIEDFTQQFFENLSNIHAVLLQDLNVFYDFDPAAKDKAEILIAYPGFFAITFYRIANYLWTKEIPVLPRIISEYVHSKTGIDIHPGAKIGKRFFIDHGTGIVIGETSEIGNDVTIYQGVTLGALVVNKSEAEKKRHPTIGDGVIIYANATILGGKTIIGDKSTIGGNVWVTNSIPENSLVYHKSEIIIKDKSSFPEPLNYII